VSDAMILIVAFALNPDGPSEPPAEDQPQTMNPRLEEPAVPAPSPVRRDGASAGASMLFDTATLPSVGFGAEVSAGWSLSALQLDVTGVALSSRSATLAAKPNEGADFWVGQVGGRGCYDLVRKPVGIGPCLEAGVQWVVAHGFGSNYPTSAVGQAVVSGLGGRIAGRISRAIGVRAGGEVVFPLARPTFVIDGGGLVYQVPVASFRGTAGLEVHF
jgi:hypothetical protein